MLDFLVKLKEWFFDLGDDLYKLINGPVGAFVKKNAPAILTAIKDAAEFSELRGTEKRDKAREMLVPVSGDLANFVVNAAIDVVYANWAAEQEKIDTDGDGVPDYRDMCVNLGAPEGGCVTEDGCPDADRDGVADADDPCPNDPNC